MSHVAFVQATWNQLGSATVYGRLTANDATGTALRGEGKALRRQDVASITYQVFEIGTPSMLINQGVVDKNVSMFDTLQTNENDPVWTQPKGFNFRHNLGPDNFPLGGKTYLIEYKITTNGGTVGWARYRGPSSHSRTQ